MIPMILRLEIILPVVSYERKNIIFYVNILNLRKITLLIIFFAIEFFITIASYQFLKNDWTFIYHGLFMGGNILYNLNVSNFESKILSS